MDSLSTISPPDGAQVPPATVAAGSRVKTLRIGMAIGWTLTICFLCWMPGEWVQEVEEGSPWFQVPDLDKVVHWIIFVAFTVLWLRTGTSPWRYAWVALGGLALAAGTELVQNLPAIGRDAEVGDAITDLIGVAIGLATARWLEPPLRWTESLLFRAPAAWDRPR